MADINSIFISSGKSPSPREKTALLRVIDAEINRTSEGMRVIEDYTRFVLDDSHLTGLYKNLRHDLRAAVEIIETHQLLAARDTQQDVGREISATDEYERPDTSGLILANCKRIEQSLRSLEEFTKILFPEVSQRIEPLRYRAYTLARAIEITHHSLQRLESARLYVLIDGRDSLEEMEECAQLLIDAEVDVIQLRDKKLNDKELIGRARAVRSLTAESKTLFIMNDRPDIALLSRADGVHVGQEELSVKDIRSIIGPCPFVGVSTHSLPQAKQAVLDGADYIGIGPTFPTNTKHFEQFPGLDFLQEVNHEIRLPAFAIGGIKTENLAQVLETGVNRIAVSSAVMNTPNPKKAIRELNLLLRKSMDQQQ